MPSTSDIEGTEVAGDAKRQRHVPHEVEQLDKAIDYLSGVVNDLEVRLNTVLTSAPPEEQAKDEAEVASGGVALASDIRELKWRVDSIIRTVESIRKRLEL